MKTFHIIFATMTIIAWESSSQAAECSNKSMLKKLKLQEAKLSSYQAPTPDQGTDSGQKGGEAQHSANMNEAIAAANSCVGTMSAYKLEFDKIEKELKEAEGCEKPAKRARKGALAAASKGSQCGAAGGEAGQQGGESKGNEDKMGEGGGMPKMPQIPQMPQKKEEKKGQQQDPLQKEKERQARITGCKSGVNNNLESKKRSCESQFPYNEAYPVADQKQKQDNCKQNEIFISQAELNQCEANNPPGL